MTTLDTARLAPTPPIFSRFTQGMIALWVAFQERRRERQQLAYLTRYDARLLADMGVGQDDMRAIARRRGDDLNSWRYRSDTA